VNPRRALAIALPALALVAAGCGGGGSSDESTATTTAATTTALTKAQLIEQGDAICAEVNAAVGTVGASSTTSSSASQAAGLYGGMVNSLTNLGAPQEAAGYSEFAAAAEALAKAEDEVKLAAERGDPEALASAESSASSALGSFQEAAAEYGFEDCSEGPKAPTGGSTGAAETGGAEAPESGGGEAVEETPEAVEETPEAAPETGGGAEGGGTGGGGEAGGGPGGGEGSSGGIGPG